LPIDLSIIFQPSFKRRWRLRANNNGRVDIDINFGKPMLIKKYITTSSGMSKMLADNNPYLNRRSLKISSFKNYALA